MAHPVPKRIKLDSKYPEQLGIDPAFVVPSDAVGPRRIGSAGDPRSAVSHLSGTQKRRLGDGDPRDDDVRYGPDGPFLLPDAKAPEKWPLPHAGFRVFVEPERPDDQEGVERAEHMDVPQRDDPRIQELCAHFGLRIDKIAKPRLFKFDEGWMREDGLGTADSTTIYRGVLDGKNMVFKLLNDEMEQPKEAGRLALNQLATHAYDRLLGFGVAVESVLAITEIDGELCMGLLSPLVTGKDPCQLSCDDLGNWQRGHVTSLIDQLLCLQLLDFLVTECDHLDHNYFVDIERDKVSVKAFDNDRSFALVQFTDKLALMPLVMESRARSVLRIEKSHLDGILRLFDALDEPAASKAARRTHVMARLDAAQSHIRGLDEVYVIPQIIWDVAPLILIDHLTPGNSIWGRLFEVARKQETLIARRRSQGLTVLVNSP